MMDNNNVMLSRPCTYNELVSDDFLKWTNEIKESPTKIHRKVWEWDLIIDTIYKSGYMKDGVNGLGFAVGQEPLPALFAKYGCKILVTDLSIESPKAKGWVSSNQHTDSISVLNQKGICPNNIFNDNVSYQNVDMLNIPEHLKNEQFDFLWSSCAIEHIGSRSDGFKFVCEAMDCLKPGGMAIHTTEFNVSSNLITLDWYLRGRVMYRKRDILNLKKKLNSDGNLINVDFTLGITAFDKFVDKKPYKLNPHLKLRIGSRINPLVSTSYAIIIKKHE